MIEKLPSGKWRVRVYSGGQYVAGRTFELKRDARAWETRQAVLLKSGTWTHPDDAAVRYATWLDEWVAMQGGTASTKKKREWAAGHARRALGRLPLSAVSPMKVDKAIAAIRDEISRDTAYQVLVVVRGSLKAAQREGLIPRDPTEGVRLPRSRPNEPRPLTHRQLWALADAASSEADRAQFLLMGYGGARWGEVSAVRPSQVSARGVRLTNAYAEVHGRLVLGDLKDHEARTVPLPGRVLDEVRAVAAKRKGAEWLFATSNETPYRNGNWTRSVLKPAAIRAGIPSITPHNLRDTAASLAIDAGATVMAVARLLGHENPSTTLTHYAALFPDSLDLLIGKLDRAIEDAVGNGGQRMAADVE